MFAIFVSARKFHTQRCFCFPGGSGWRWTPRLSLIALLLVLGNPSGITYAEPLRAVIVHDEYPLPDALSLCGEPMPLQDRLVFEMLDREFTIHVYDRAQVYMWLKRAGRYFPHIQKRLKERGMPEDIKYLAVAESALITDIRSKKGALGTWQFMAQTARRNGLRKDRTMDERRHFEKATEAALNYLQKLKDMFGSWTLALAAYNCGEALLKKEIEVQKMNDYYRLSLPRETERFVFRIASVKIIMEHPERYGFRANQDRIYRPIKCESIEVRVRWPIHMTDAAFSIGTDLKTLKELNPHILGYYLPTGRYSIKVPLGMGQKIASALKKMPRKSKRYVSGKEGFYIVKPGDTLSHISERTGISIKQIRVLNDIEDSLIKVGERLDLVP